MFSFTPLLSLLASSTLLVQGLPVIDSTTTPIFRRDSETITPPITPPISRRGSAVESTIFDNEVTLDSRSACEIDDDPIRGVNLGGWLVLEPWMNWELVGNTGAVDQWSFDQTSNAQSALQSHWQSWFGEADMAKIASWGLNTYVSFLFPRTVFSHSPETPLYTTRCNDFTRPLFSLTLAIVLDIL
jgi:aryl-phospho-beta-D-glucosidase BglC (GH1 family)